jgi:hypothetical protein
VHRLALAALLLFCPFAMSGCEFTILFCAFGPEVCPNDPKYDQHPHERQSTGRASAAGTPFTGTIRGQLTGKLTIKHFAVKSKIKSARFFGSFKATPKRNAAALGPLSNAQWHARLGGVRNRRTGRIRVKGLALATFDDAAAGRACLRLTYGAVRKQNRDRLKRRGKSTIEVVGGEGGARTLRGTATVRVKLKGHAVRLTGTVKQHRSTARGFTPACTKLEKKFGLAPVS